MGTLSPSLFSQLSGVGRFTAHGVCLLLLEDSLPIFPLFQPSSLILLLLRERPANIVTPLFEHRKCSVLHHQFERGFFRLQGHVDDVLNPQ